MSSHANSLRHHSLRCPNKRSLSSPFTFDYSMHGTQRSTSRASVIHMSARRDIFSIHSSLRRTSSDSCRTAERLQTLALVADSLACR
jgi:hypothetical protein